MGYPNMRSDRAYLSTSSRPRQCADSRIPDLQCCVWGFNWNELSDLPIENIEEAGRSISSKRPEKNGTFGKHRITQPVEALAVVRRLIGVDNPLRPSPLHHKNPHRPGTSPKNRQLAVIVQARTRR